MKKKLDNYINIFRNIINNKYFLTFLLIFIILSFFSLIQKLTTDIIWSYGFSYNILKGEIPYKDFGFVQGPLYMIINAIPLFIFGNNIIVFKITHTFIYSLILTKAYQKIDKKVFWIIIAILIQQTICWYNTLISLLIIIILILIDSNNKNKYLYIGLIIGFIMMTKQNIGLALFGVYFLTSKNKIKSTIYFSIPIAISMLYLAINHDIIQYIDFCYLGLGNFLENLRIEKVSLILLIIIIIYLIAKIIKTKDSKILYILASLAMVFPLIEIVHLLAIIPILTYYLLLTEKNINILLTIKLLLLLYFIFTETTYINNVDIIKTGKHIKYSIQSKNVNNYLKLYSNYLKSNENVYLFITNAYLIRINNDQPTTIYDHLNKGNLGSNENEYIKDIDKSCKQKTCTFILDNCYFDNSKLKSGFQYIDEYKNYVIKNYQYIETLPTGDKVYSNKKVTD